MERCRQCHSTCMYLDGPYCWFCGETIEAFEDDPEVGLRELEPAHGAGECPACGSPSSERNRPQEPLDGAADRTLGRVPRP